MRLGRRRGRPEARPGQPRLLLPFTGGALDPTVLDAALRIALAEGDVFVPACLLVIPLELDLEAAVQQDELQRAMPLLEAVEVAAHRAGVPVDSRIERGRTRIHALSRLWGVERFDRIVVPAPVGEHEGFSPKDMAWMLTNAPTEIVILRPSPEAARERESPDVA